jgi:DNA-binding GntR family transcriptional regulator
MKPITLKERAYKKIKQLIVYGELKPSQLLSINEILQHSGVGKTPTREALVLLEHEGLVEPIPRSGYRIREATIRDVLEVFHLRLLLEVEAIGLAAEKISEKEIRELELNREAEISLMEATEDEISEKVFSTKYLVINRQFHLSIAKMSGNMRLADLIADLLVDVERILIRDPFTTSEQHAAIFEALKNKDVALAKDSMRKHLMEVKARLVNRF